MIDPLDIRTWPEDARRRHRLRRALNELFNHPGYSLKVRTDEQGTERLAVSPGSVITPEAEEFIRRYKADLIVHLKWMESWRRNDDDDS